MPFDIVSTATGFLVGAATGAAGTYFAHKYTDRRREQEAAGKTRTQFLALRAQMPALFDEIATDLAGDGHALIREFFVLPNKRVVLGRSSKPRFSYFEDEHENLRGKLDILENAGYIIDVTPGNVPVYRMTETFVDLVRRYSAH